jgi:hypothetical protein
LTIWTLILHSLMVFIGGHGGANILLLEAAFFGNIIGIDDNFGFSGKWLLLIISTMIGQTLLVVTIFKQTRITKATKVAGLSALAIAAVILTLEALELGYELVTIISSLPFLACASLLTYRTIRTA